MTSVPALRGGDDALRTRGRAGAERGLMRASGRLGEFGTVQLVAIEFAVMLLLSSLVTASVTVTLIAVGGAILALVTTLSRFGGGWGYQTVGMVMALRRRRRADRRAAAVSTGLRGGSVALMAPRLAVYSYDDRGNQIGIGQDENGWFTAFAVGVDNEVIGRPGPPVQFERLIRLLDEGTARPSAVQVVSLRVPAPSVTLSADTSCVESYLELADRVTGARPGPAQHLTWIAVRLSPTDAVEAAVDRGGGLEGVHRALVAVVGRLGKILGTAGVAFRVLDSSALLEALEVSWGLDHVTALGASRSAGAADEQWSGWRAAGLQHVAFEVERWPVPFDPALLSGLAAAPAERVVVSVAVHLRGADFGLRTVVRVIAGRDRLEADIRAVSEHADGLGVRLRPMHGMHGPAVYASAPTGGWS